MDNRPEVTTGLAASNVPAQRQLQEQPETVQGITHKKRQGGAVHWLEKIANVAIVVTCALVIANLGRNYYLSHRPDPRLRPDIAVGQLVQLPGNAPADPQPTLVLALSTRCHFCQESMPFYHKLAAFKKSSPQGLRLVAVLPERQETAAAYLKEQSMETDAVVSVPLTQLGLKGTPTLLLLDGQNKLEQLWVGRLDEAQESQVLARLKQACSECSLPASQF